MQLCVQCEQTPQAGWVVAELPSGLLIVWRCHQKLKTTFIPAASAFEIARFPPGLTMYWTLGWTSRPGRTVHP